jgi:hypothetical protein
MLTPNPHCCAESSVAEYGVPLAGVVFSLVAAIVAYEMYGKKDKQE